MSGTHIGVVYGISDLKIRRIVAPDDAGRLKDPRHLRPGELMRVISAASYRLCSSASDVAKLTGLQT